MTCPLCTDPIDGAHLVDPDSGATLHPACFAARLPHDALVLALEALALIAVPTVVLWAS
jgi:hypothetical protein